MRNRRWRILAAALIAAPAIIFSLTELPAGRSDRVEISGAARPAGLPRVVWPADNPYSPEKVELGKLLYFDPRLSADNTVSCASCHMPSKGFADGRPVSIGIRGQKGTRNAPTVLNSTYNFAQFLDGRAATLEEQAIGPIENPVEMGNTHAAVVAKLRGIAGYRDLFREAFGTEEFTIGHVGKALAAFERTVLSGNSPFDRYKAGSDPRALTPEQIRGLGVFTKEGRCTECHDLVNFGTAQYHNIGVGTDKPNPDPGRFAVTKNPKDWAAFRSPTLRDIVHTAPYMHDGSLRTLEEVVDYYDRGGIPNQHLDPKMQPLRLSLRQKKDLVAFLHALSGEGWQGMKPPASFPK